MNVNRIGVIGGGLIGLAALGYGTYRFLKYRQENKTRTTRKAHESEI
jgi:hypothetical protein